MKTSRRRRITALARWTALLLAFQGAGPAGILRAQVATEFPIPTAAIV